MSHNIKDISSLALKLPRRSRALLADLLLDSLEEGPVESYEEDWLKVARARDAELTEGTVQTINHEELMDAARKAIKCSK